MNRLGIDGYVDVGNVDGQSCCPPTLCDLDLCSMICNFVNLLPRGPLWDNSKKNVLDRYRNGCNGTETIPCPAVPEACTTLVAHSIYTARKIHDVLVNGLFAVVREFDPRTAYFTLDDWLERLGWVDCYGSACRSAVLGALTPYEIEGDCGPVFVAPDAPEALQKAVKRGVVLALVRLNMGIIKNLDGINFVLEPLGAELVPFIDACTVDPDTGETACPIVFSILPTAGLTRACELTCPTYEQYYECVNNPIQNSYNPGVVGLPETIYPGLLSAECIVRSLLPQDGSVKIIQYS